jgi:hypothetical protein
LNQWDHCSHQSARCLQTLAYEAACTPPWKGMGQPPETLCQAPRGKGLGTIEVSTFAILLWLVTCVFPLP